MNPIQQAEQALEAFLTGDLTPYAAAQAIDSLRSLQKEVEGVGLPTLLPSDHPEPHTLVWSKVEIEAIQAYARTAVAADLGRGVVPQGWTPTPENINALPAPVRSYIHELVANADPAGTVRDLTIARDTVRALESSNRALRDLDTPGNRHPEFRFAGYAGEPLPENYTPDQHAAYDEGVRARIAAPSPEATQPTQAEAPTQRLDAPDFGPCPAISRGDAEAAWSHGCLTGYRAALATQQAVQGETKSDGVDRLLREVFALCEATEDAPEVDPKNEHQRGFDKGRRFEAKQIRRAIGDWFQSEFCGRSFMGEPVIATPPAPGQVEPVDVCTDPDNCQRCKAPSWDKHNHRHAGISGASISSPGQVERDREDGNG